MTPRNPLINAPPRLSDLHGDARMAALNARHEGHRADWLAARVQKPGVVARFLAVVMGSGKGLSNG